MSAFTAGSMSDWLAPGSAAMGQAIRRAASPGYESWWQRCAAVGFCANPIQASAYHPDQGKRVAVMIRCGNRRASVCPSCSDIYAADTWQLIHAGTAGGHHGMPTTIGDRPQVFTTLTAPSFGAMHTSRPRPGRPGGPCHPAKPGKTYCPHGNPLCCNTIHQPGDREVGEPLCPECYDYTGHALFNWHAPELWRRLTIALRRTLSRHLRHIGVDPDTMRVSFVKVAEYQRRAIIHYHALIRLDPTNGSQDTTDNSGSEVSAAQLAALVRQAACQVRLAVSTHTATADPDTACLDRVLRFGAQIDTQPLTVAADTAEPASGLARRVAAYLAKYTTKSVAEFGIAARRISPQAIAELDLPAHTRRILTALTRLATLPGNTAMLAWLHTLGYRGHITTKSRRYSTTMTALRAVRHHWRQRHSDQAEHVGHQNTPYEEQHQLSAASELTNWRIQSAGLRNDGERLLVNTAALRAREYPYLARLDTSQNSGASP